jgi:hypothetical protein
MGEAIQAGSWIERARDESWSTTTDTDRPLPSLTGFWRKSMENVETLSLKNRQSVVTVSFAIGWSCRLPESSGP